MATSVQSNGKHANGEAKSLKAEEGHVQANQEDSFKSAMQWMGSIVLSMALNSAFEVGVFEIIAKAGEGAKLSAKDIAAQIGTNNPEAPIMLDRLLRLLASHSVLNCSVLEDKQKTGLPQSLYSLTPGSRYFVNDADGVSLGPVLSLILDEVFIQSW